MTQSWSGTEVGGSGRGVAIDAAVRVYPGTPSETHGVVIEDFGSLSGHAVDIGDHHIADAARRWAVQLADGTLVFLDDADLKPY